MEINTLHLNPVQKIVPPRGCCNISAHRVNRIPVTSRYISCFILVRRGSTVAAISSAARLGLRGIYLRYGAVSVSLRLSEVGIRYLDY